MARRRAVYVRSGYRCHSMRASSSARRAPKAAGGRPGSLVDVEPDGHVDPGRVVALHRARRRAAGLRSAHRVLTPARSRHGADRVGVRRQALVGGERHDVRRHLGQALVVDGHDVDVLAEVVDPQGPREPGRAVGGQHVVGAGQVVADGRRRQRAAEHRAGVADQRQQRLGVVHEQLEVLGGDGVGHGHGLLGVVAHHRVPALGQRGLEVLASGRRGHEPGHRVGHGVGHRLVPRDQPGQPVGAVLGLEDDVDGRPARAGCRRRPRPRPRTAPRTTTARRPAPGRPPRAWPGPPGPSPGRRSRRRGGSTRCRRPGRRSRPARRSGRPRRRRPGRRRRGCPRAPARRAGPG